MTSRKPQDVGGDNAPLAPLASKTTNPDLAPTPDAPWGWAISRKGTRYKRPRPHTESEKAAARAAMEREAEAIERHERDRELGKELPKNLKPHALARMFRSYTDDEFNDLVADLRTHGQQFPIIIYEGMILDGVNRYKAALKAGIKPRGKPFTGLNSAAFVCSANVHRRHLGLTSAKKRELIAQVLKESPELSDRQVAKVTKTHHETVGAERTELESRGEIATSETRADTKGRKQPAHKAAKPKPTIGIEKIRGPEPKPGQPAAEFVSEMRKSLVQPKEAGEPLKIVSTEPPRPPLVKLPVGEPPAELGSLHSPFRDLLEFARFVVGRIPDKRSKHAGISIAIAQEDVDEFDLLLGNAKVAIEKWRRS